MPFGVLRFFYSPLGVKHSHCMLCSQTSRRSLSCCQPSIFCLPFDLCSGTIKPSYRIGQEDAMRFTIKGKIGLGCIFIGLFGGIGSMLSGLLNTGTGIAAVLFWVLLGLVCLSSDLRFYYLSKQQGKKHNQRRIRR